MGNKPSEHTGVSCSKCKKVLPPCDSFKKFRRQHIEGKEYYVFNFESDDNTYYRLVGDSNRYVCPTCLFQTTLDLFECEREQTSALQQDTSAELQLLSFDIEGIRAQDEYMLHKMEGAEARRSEFGTYELPNLLQNGLISSVSENAGILDRSEYSLEQALLTIPYGTEKKLFPELILNFLNDLENNIYSLSREKHDWVTCFLLDLFTRLNYRGQGDIAIASTNFVCFVVDCLGDNPLLIDLINFNKCVLSLLNSKVRNTNFKGGDILSSVFVEQLLDIPWCVNRRCISKCQEYYTRHGLPDNLKIHKDTVLHLLRSHLWNKNQIDKLCNTLMKRIADSSHYADTTIESLKLYSTPGSEKVLETLQTSNINDIPLLLKTMSSEGNEKDLKVVMKELRDNQSLSKKTIEKIENALKMIDTVFQSESIHDAAGHDVKDLQVAVESVLELQGDSDMNDIVALICAAIGVLTFRKYRPRYTQLISCLLFILRKEKGQLLEVSTGEGKSCVIAMIAVILCWKNLKVDIITSSSVLAGRDYESWKSFFQYFQITVGRNDNLAEKDDCIRCYKNNVVYGTVESFCADILREDFYQIETRKRRTFDVAIADEVDYMLLDRGVQFTYLSNDVTSMRHVEPVLAMIWYHVSQYEIVRSERFETFFQCPAFPFYYTINTVLNSVCDCSDTEIMFDILTEAEGKNFLYDGFCAKLKDLLAKDVLDVNSCLKEVTKDNLVKILELIENNFEIEFLIFDLPDNERLIKQVSTVQTNSNVGTIPLLLIEGGQLCELYNDYEELVKAIEERVLANLTFHELLENCAESDDNKLQVPRFLEPLVEKQLLTWIRNAFVAKDMQIDREYIVDNNRILPIDFKFTGVTELNKRWGDGLQQFLEMKHLLALSKMTLTTNFLSNVSYFRKYNQLLGVSGTLGSEIDHNFLQEMYDVKLCSIPTYMESRFIEIDGQVALEKTEWLNKICQAIENEILPGKSTFKGRAALVLCEDIISAKEVQQAIKTKLDGKLRKVSMYTRSETEEMRNIKETLQPADIIVATNLAGRGTDIKVSEDVNHGGGLFVLITFLPLNQRVEYQAKGRTARKGQPGSAQMIVLKDHLSMRKAVTDSSDFEKIKSMRNDLERIRKDAFKQRIQGIIFKDYLFKEYCSCLKQVRLDLQDMQKKKLENLFQSFHEEWGIWLKVHSTECSDDHILDSFEEFKKHLLSTALTFRETSIAGNVYTITRIANESLSEGNYEEAMKQYEKAISVGGIWASLAFYNKAFCLLKLAGTNCVKESLECLTFSSKLIKTYFNEMNITLTLVHNSLHKQKQNKQNNDTQYDFSVQMQIRFQIMKCFEDSVLSVRKYLEEIQTKNINAKAVFGRAVFSLCGGMYDPTFETELQDIWQLGLTQIFEVAKRPKFVWNQFFVLAIGISQMAVGALFLPVTCGILTSVCIGLIVEGITDVLEASFGMIMGRNFTWKRWGLNKTISLALIFVMPIAKKYAQVGLRALKPAGKIQVSKLPSAMKHTAQVVLSDAKHVFSKASAVTAKTGFQRFTVLKVVKESGGLIAKQFCTTFATKCGPELLDILAIKTLITCFRKYLISVFEREVTKIVTGRKMTSLITIIASSEWPEVQKVLPRINWGHVIEILERVLKERLNKYKTEVKFINKITSLMISFPTTLAKFFKCDIYTKKKLQTAQKVLDKLKAAGVISTAGVAFTFSQLYIGLEKKLENDILLYIEENNICENPNAPKNPGFQNQLKMYQKQIAKSFNELICEEVTSIMEDEVTGKIFHFTTNSVSSIFTEKINIHRTKETIMARAHGRFIEYGRVNQDVEALSVSSARTSVLEYADRVEGDDGPNTLLEARILSKTLDIDINIMEEQQDRSLTTVAAISNNSSGRSVSLLYRNGNYDSSFSGKGNCNLSSQSLFDAVANATSSSTGHVERKAISTKYRKQVAQELRQNPKWDEFYKRQTITMKLHGGERVLLSGRSSETQ